MKGILHNLFFVKELRDKLFFTLFILIIFRFGAYLPIPGIDPIALKSYFKTQSEFSLSRYFDFFSGGAFTNFSVFMLSIGPYISSSIIIQLVMFSFPQIKKMYDAEGGKRKVKRYTKYLTVLIAMIQAYAVSLYAKSIPGAVVIPFTNYVFITIVTVTTGTFILMWFGEQITQRGIGNGISILIFSGIVVRLQSAIYSLISGINDSLYNINPIFVVILIILFISLAISVVYEYMAQMRIPIHYSRASMNKANSSYLPIKLNPAGVLPVIFSSVILSFPVQILGGFLENSEFARNLMMYLRPDGSLHMFLTVILIVLFTYFYSKLQLSPKDMANQLRQNGIIIPGVRAEGLEAYLDSIMNKTLFWGAIFLSVIAIIPYIVQNIFRFPPEVSQIVGGTSLLIMIGVALDTISQLDSFLKTKGVISPHNKRDEFLQNI